MTSLRSSQLDVIAVEGGSARLEASQLMVITVSRNPAAAHMNVSQLFGIVVIGNGKSFLPLQGVHAMPCWQPCNAYGTHALIEILGGD